ncbi:hypothetical protein LTR66_011641, partial [Elasticomyces elasticus]
QTLLRSLHLIYLREGLAGLYAGLDGEVLKGFLGHGLTMLLKARLHALLVVDGLALRDRFDPAKLRVQAGKGLASARESATAVVVDAGERLAGARESATAVVVDAGGRLAGARESATAVVVDAGGRAQTLGETVVGGAQSLGETVVGGAKSVIGGGRG